MNILVTGGAGYIGSFMVRKLLENGHKVVIVDHLSHGNKQIVDERATLQEGSILDKSFLSNVFSGQNIDAVVHFAGLISMGESMIDPGKYFTVNTMGSINLLEAMRENSVNKIIFSSTAGVYGNPENIPTSESDPKNPTNPYGESKLMVERVLAWYQKIHSISSVSLRYFNACGASLDGKFGEEHHPETHLIPNVIKSMLDGKEFVLFGDDYDTPDGTCVRDYIHVEDLVEAHVLALEKISDQPGGYVYNVGTGKGYSNKEVIAEIERISGKKVSVVIRARRPGDAAQLIANSEAIHKELAFVPRYSDLSTIIETAWKFHTQ